MKENINKKSKRIIPIIITLVVLGLVFVGINRFNYYNRYVDTDDAQIDGNLVAVVTRVGGYIDEINFEDNQLVKQGQLLVKINNHEYQIGLNKANTNKRVVESSIDVAKAQIVTSQSVAKELLSTVNEQKAKLWQAEQEYKRYHELLKLEAISQQIFDKIKVNRDVAEASYQTTLDKYQTALSEIESQKSQLNVTYSNIQQQEVDIEKANLLLSYSDIKAPVSGIVTRKKALVGQMIQPGQTLFSIVDQDNMYVTANFKETQLRNIKPGQKVMIHIDAYPEAPIHGVIYNFSATTGAKTALLPPDNATGNFVKVVQRVPVKIQIDNKDNIYKLLRPGMNVEVIVDTKS